MLETHFSNLLLDYEVDSNTIEKFWEEIYLNYSKANRHYHNLTHLEDLFSQMTLVKDHIKNWNATLFALFYHDIIYSTTKRDNELKSADLAKERMNSLGVPEEDKHLCYEQIIASKDHALNSNSDINYFTDADLSILGRDSLVYQDYCKRVRKEYSIYPGFLYKKGRRKVIHHFLSMNRIFKTEEFYTRYEKQAYFNLQKELETL